MGQEVGWQKGEGRRGERGRADRWTAAGGWKEWTGNGGGGLRHLHSEGERRDAGRDGTTHLTLYLKGGGEQGGGGDSEVQARGRQGRRGNNWRGSAMALCTLPFT